MLKVLASCRLWLGPSKRCKEALTGMRSAYFWRMRSASALRFSKGCSSLNFDRMIAGFFVCRLLGSSCAGEQSVVLAKEQL